MNNNDKKIKTHRTIAMLSREELDFLDKIGKDALFSTGHKLTYNDIMRSLIKLAMESGVSGERADSINTLKEKIAEKIRDERRIK